MNYEHTWRRVVHWSTKTLPALGLLCLAGCAGNPGVEPATYASPLVRLQRFVGANNHLHTDEVRYRASDQRLFQCSYTFGVIDTRNPENLVYLAENLRHTIPGDKRTPGCIHLAWEGDEVYTVHRGNVDNPAFLSGWSLQADPADPAKLKPVQLPVLQEPGVSYEGIDTANGLIYVAEREKGLAIYKREARRGFVKVGGLTDLNNSWGVRVRGTTAFVSDGLAGLAVVNVADPERPVLVGKAATGGQARGLALHDNVAYLAAGSAGLVVVDIADLAAPRVIGKAATPGTAVRVDYSDGRVYVAAWNDARVYDVSTPAQPRFVGAARMTQQLGNADDGRPPVTSRTLGIAAAGDVMFVGNWHVIYSYRVHADRKAPSLVLPEEINLVDFGPVEAGKRATVPIDVTNQGTAPLTVFNIAADNPQFTVEPRQAVIPAGGKASLAVTYTATDTSKATSFLSVESDDPDNSKRRGYLVSNQPGLGVGKPLPETTVALVDGGQWTSGGAKGQVILLGYFATF